MQIVRPLLALFVLGSAALPAAAQEAELPAGQRVRLLAPAGGFSTPVIANVAAVEDGLLVVELAGSARRGYPPLESRLPVSTIAELEVSRGARNRGVSGAAGLAIGTLAGFAAAGLHRRFSSECGSRCGLQGPGVVEYDESNSWVIRGMGAAIGLGVGVALPGERWEPVPFRTLRVGPAR